MDLAVPLQTAKQDKFVPDILALSFVGWVIVILCMVSQPLVSVTVTLYVPVQRPVMAAVVLTGIVFHEYVYGEVPPEGAAVAVPLHKPKQVMSVLVGLAINNAG